MEAALLRSRKKKSAHQEMRPPRTTEKEKSARQKTRPLKDTKKKIRCFGEVSYEELPKEKFNKAEMLGKPVLEGERWEHGSIRDL